MNILLIGSGGREHAIAWKLNQSNRLTQLFIAPGNAGTAFLGTNVEINPNDFESLGNFSVLNHIDMVVVGPEEPLVKGIHDFFLSTPGLENIPVIGPPRQGAMLEGSKDFAKQFMVRHHIPTARYKSFQKDQLDEAKRFLESLQPPFVLKADGLAAGKGVLILHDRSEAGEELERMFSGKFGDAGTTVVIEEFLKGIELSVFILTDGTSYMILPEAKDYKRIGEGDTGLNTGGMGSVSPVPFADDVFMKKVEDRIIKPTIEGLRSDSIPYTGFLFIGLMNVNGNPYVIEYNVRMGDPETESVMPRLKNDLLELFVATVEGRLSTIRTSIDDRTVATVILVSGGYPGSYEKGKEIHNLEQVSDSILFHSGTKIHNNQVITNGGRVLAVSSYGTTIGDAVTTSVENAKKIDFEGNYFRHDIGFDL